MAVLTAALAVILLIFIFLFKDFFDSMKHHATEARETGHSIPWIVFCFIAAFAIVGLLIALYIFIGSRN